MTKAVTLAELADQNVLTATDNKVGIATTNPQSTLQVGTGITMDGNAGVITAQAYYGDGSNLTGIDASSIKDSNGTVRVQATTTGAVVTGILTATSFSGIDASSLKDTNDTVRVQATTTGATITGDLTVDNISVGGTLTYDDVTNVDSIGIVTARSGIVVVSGGATITGVSTFYSAVKVGTAITIDSASGVITATKFSGDGSGLIGVASTDNIITGTAATFNNVVKVGTGITMDSASGIITATAFYGDGSNLTFTPKIIAFDPAALSTGVAVDTNITITFDQDIEFYGTGTIELRSTSASGTVIEDFNINGPTPPSGLSISGTQLIINPTNNLGDNTVVYVILPIQGIRATSGQAYYAGSNNYNFRTVQQSFSAQGGDHVYTLVDGSSPTGYYKYHVFTSNTGIATFSSPTTVATNFKIMLLGGGGAGGGYGPSPYSRAAGGGGGAGGLLQHTGPTLNLPSGTYDVIVGSGGTAHPMGGSWSDGVTAMNGQASRLDGNGLSVVASGGGGGGQGTPTNGPHETGSFAGTTGGSGGGGGGRWMHPNNNPNGYSNDLQDSGGGGVPGQGNAGGNGYNLIKTSHIGIPLASRPGNSANQHPASYDVGVSGGGGGAGGAGGPGNNLYSYGSHTPEPSNRQAHIGGKGGDGLAVPEFGFIQLNGNAPTIPSDILSSIGPTGLYGGGGGGCGSPGPGKGAGGLPGPGGGGAGLPWQASAQDYLNAGYSSPGAPGNGNDYQGGGGGGSPQGNGYNGGKGLVIFRYAVPGS